MADIPLVPEGNVLHGCQAIRPDQPRQSGEILRGDGIAFVRHGGGSLLSFGEKFFGFKDLGPLEVPQLHREFFHGRGDDGQSGEKFGMVVPLDDLRGDGSRLEPQPLADRLLDRGWNVRKGSHRARHLADADRLLCPLHPDEVSLHLVIPESHLEAEGDGFGMNSVRPPDHQRPLMGEGFLL